MRRVSRTFHLTLFIIGFTLSVVGVLYLITPAEALPSFLGGMHHEGLHAGTYHTKRADIALILGVFTLIASGWLYARSARLREPVWVPNDASDGWTGAPSDTGATRM